MADNKIIFSMVGVSKTFPPHKKVLNNIYLYRLGFLDKSQLSNTELIDDDMGRMLLHNPELGALNALAESCVGTSGFKKALDDEGIYFTKSEASEIITSASPIVGSKEAEASIVTINDNSSELFNKIREEGIFKTLIEEIDTLIENIEMSLMIINVSEENLEGYAQDFVNTLLFIKRVLLANEF